MAYELLQEQTLITDGSLAAAADIAGAKFAPGYIPVTIRAVSLVITDTIACAGVVKLDKRPTPGSDAGRGDGDVVTISIPNATAVGAVIYKDQLNVKINPGEEVVAECTDAAGASGKATIKLIFEPSYEVPANFSEMSESA